MSLTEQQKLINENLFLKTQNQQKTGQIEHLLETIQILRMKIFAPKSERIKEDANNDQAGLFDEAEADVLLAELE